MDNLVKLVTKFYASFSPRLRVYIYSATSLLIATFLGLLSRDILALDISNEYLVTFLVFVTGLINVIQKEVTDLGTQKLAEQGDVKTIGRLVTRIEDTKAILGK